MKTLYLLDCPLCNRPIDYHNMTTGVCRDCQDEIDRGNDTIINRYMAIPLEKMVAILEISEKMRLGRR